MSDHLKKFDPHSLTDQVRDRIRLTIVDLVPEEAWKAMIQREIDVFLTPQKREYGGGYNDSALHSVVQEIMREEVRSKLVEMLRGPDWQGFWDGQRAIAGAEIKKLVTENATTIMVGMIGSAIQQTINNAVSQLTYGRTQ